MRLYLIASRPPDGLEEGVHGAAEVRRIAGLNGGQRALDGEGVDREVVGGAGREGDVEEGGPALALELDPFAFVCGALVSLGAMERGGGRRAFDGERWAVARRLHYAAEEDGDVGDGDGVEGGGVLDGVSELGDALEPSCAGD